MAIKRKMGGALAASTLSVVAALCTTGAIAQSSATLNAVKSRGTVRCGIHAGLAGFAYPDKQGKWKGLEIDVCRAVAAAVLGKADQVLYIPLSAKDRFTALQSGEIDLLARVTTWTFARNTATGLDFVGVYYLDGQGFMVKGNSNIKSAAELNGASICVVQGTSTEKTLADYFAARSMKYEPVAFSETEAVANAYLSGRCDALTSDRSQLAAIRSTVNNPDTHTILPDVISKEPLGPSVRFGDHQWANIVRWSFNAMIEAEELGLTSANAQSMSNASEDPSVRRFTGKVEKLGEMIGLDDTWALRIIEQVGNYGESFQRNISPIGLDRGVNKLWRDGGIMISPPFR